jgi:hypothetical protein
MLEYIAWNNGIGRRFYFVGFRTDVMINRDSWGHSYSIVRGEILGFMKTNYCESICQGCFH